VNRLASWDQLSGQTLQQQLAEVVDKVWLQQREHDELVNTVRALKQQQLEGSAQALEGLTSSDIEAQVNACFESFQAAAEARIEESLRLQQEQLQHTLKLMMGVSSNERAESVVEPGSLENRVCEVVLESSRQSSRIDTVTTEVRLLQERIDALRVPQDRDVSSHRGSPRAPLDAQDPVNDAAVILKELKEERGAVLDMMDGLRTHKLEVIAMLHTFQMDKQEAMKDLEAIWHAVRTDLAHVEMVKGELTAAASQHRAVRLEDESMEVTTVSTNGERKVARIGSISPERRPRVTSAGVVTKGGGLTVPAPTTTLLQTNYSPKAVPRGHSMQYLEGNAKSQQNLRMRQAGAGVQRFPSAGCLSARDITQATAPPDLSPSTGPRRTSTRAAVGGASAADFAHSPGPGPLTASQSAMASSPQRCCGGCQVSRMSSTALCSGAPTGSQPLGSAAVLTSPHHSSCAALQQSPVVVHSTATLGASHASVSRMSSASAQQQGSMLTQATANSPQQSSTQQCPVVSRMSSASVHLGQMPANPGVLTQTVTMRTGW